MKKFIIAITLLLSLFNLYLNVRLAAWANMVGAPYMMGLEKGQRCDRHVAVKDINDVRQHAKMEQKSMCPIDERSCDEVDKTWSDYEDSRKRFHKMEWTDTFIGFITEDVKNLLN